MFIRSLTSQPSSSQLKNREKTYSLKNPSYIKQFTKRKWNSEKYDRFSNIVDIVQESAQQINPDTVVKDVVPLRKENPCRVLRQKQKIFMLVRGQLFETFESTLAVFPNTLLGNKQKRNEYYNQKTNMFVFDRCSISFDAILFYYQSQGILSKPGFVARETFIAEVKFFKIDVFIDDMHRDEVEFLQQRKQKRNKPAGKWRKMIWCLLEYNLSSSPLIFWFCINVAVLVLSVGIYCLETLPFMNSESSWCFNVWMILELFFSTFYVCEYGMRIYVCLSIKGYALSSLGITDIASFLPSYILLLNCILGIHSKKLDTSLKFLRIFRIFKVIRFNRGIKSVVITLYECRATVILLYLSIVLVSLCFSALIYTFESESSNETGKTFFTSIADALWFSIITATGVGYGDIYPTTEMGKTFGCTLALLGILLFSLPTTMLVCKFIECYYLREMMSNDCDVERRKLIGEVRKTFIGQFDPRLSKEDVPYASLR